MKRSLKYVERHLFHSLILDFYPEKSPVWMLSFLTPKEISTLHIPPVFQTLLGAGASKTTPTVVLWGSWFSSFAQSPLGTVTNNHHLTLSFLPTSLLQEPPLHQHSAVACWVIPEPIPTLLPLRVLSHWSLCLTIHGQVECYLLPQPPLPNPDIFHLGGGGGCSLATVVPPLHPASSLGQGLAYS